MDVILCNSLTALSPVQRRSGSWYALYSFSLPPIYLRCLYRVYFSMPVPTTTKNSSPFFLTPMDDKNLITQAKVAKALFFLQISGSIQPLLHQPCSYMYSLHFFFTYSFVHKTKTFFSISIPFIPGPLKLFES